VGARQLCSFTGASPPHRRLPSGGSSRSQTLDFGNVFIDDRTVTAGKFLKRPASSLSFCRKIRRLTYAQNRASFRSGDIRIFLDSTGNVERTIAFSEADRKL